MALIHVPPTDVPYGDDRRLPADEIIHLTDRRRVLLHVVLGIDVSSSAADAIFDVGRGRSWPTIG